METNRSDDDTSTRQLLKKAYVWMNFGHYERAAGICEQIEQSDRDSLLAATLRGAILTASGRPVDGMKRLMRVHRRHPDAILCSLYLAEACFLAGRTRRAWSLLDDLDDDALEESPYREFAEQLRTTWNQLEDHDDLPEPLTVPLGDESDDASARE